MASLALSMTSIFHWKYFSFLFQTLLNRSILATSLSKLSKSTYGTSLSDLSELTSLSFSSKAYISAWSSGSAKSLLSFSWICLLASFVMRLGPQTALIRSVIPISSTLLGYTGRRSSMSPCWVWASRRIPTSYFSCSKRVKHCNSDKNFSYQLF